MTERVAVVAPHYPEYTINFAASLAESQDVLAIVDTHQLKSEFAGRGELPVGYARLVTSSFSSLRDLLALLLRVSCFRPKVVLFQEAAGPRRAAFNAIIAILFKPFANIVLTVHDPVPHAGRDQVRRDRSKAGALFLRWFADVVVVHGDYCARMYRAHKWAAHQKIVVVNHGVILQPHEPSARSSILRLYVFGRMEAYKGVRELAEAVRELDRRNVEYELIVTGRGPELEKYEEQLKASKAVRVREGFVSPVDLIENLRAAHGVVLPYTSATQSGVLAAGLGAGCFAICTRVGGLTDVVTDGRNGLVVPPGDVDALAGAIERVASDAMLRERLMLGARETAARDLQWTAIAREVLIHTRSVSRRLWRR